MAKTYGAVLVGVEIEIVEIEAFVGSGFSGLTILGIAGDAARDMRERVRAALEVSGVGLPARRIVVNIGPVQTLRLCRTQLEELDFAVAAAIALALSKDKKSRDSTVAEKSLHFFGGALSLSGELRAVERSLVFDALEYNFREQKKGYAVFNVSRESAVASPLSFNLYATFAEWLLSLQEKKEQRLERENLACHKVLYGPSKQDRFEAILNVLNVFSETPKLLVALLAAAAGRHNILLTGEPGVGKSFAMRHMESLLPPLKPSEAFQVQLIAEERGSSVRASALRRPFRSPHHSCSVASLVGGANLRPGEATLAHAGVLFLDELAEYTRSSIEALREPLDSGRIALSKSAGSVTFPADFFFCATTNPCPCGFLFSRRRSCRCTHGEIARYHAKLSGPILDRFAIQLAVEADDRELDGFARQLRRELSEKGDHALAERFLVCQDNLYASRSNGEKATFLGETPLEISSRRSQEHLNRVAITLGQLFPSAIGVHWADVFSYRVLEEKMARIRS